SEPTARKSPEEWVLVPLGQVPEILESECAQVDSRAPRDDAPPVRLAPALACGRCRLRGHHRTRALSSRPRTSAVLIDVDLRRTDWKSWPAIDRRHSRARTQARWLSPARKVRCASDRKSVVVGKG